MPFFSCKKKEDDNYPNEFVPSQVDNTPKTRLETYLISSLNQFSYDISKTDSLHALLPVIHSTGDYSHSAIYSSGHTLFVIGNRTGNFNAYDLSNNSLLFSKPSGSTSLPTFQNLFLEDDIAYVSYYNGNIRGYDKTGSQKYEVQQTGYFIPDAILKNNRYLFAELYYPSFHESRIGTFYLVSGAQKQERRVYMKINNMYTLDETHILLFGNDSVTGTGKIEVYDETGNGTVLLHTIPTGQLNNVVQIDATHYFISHSDGIYLYNYSINGLTPFVSGFPVYSLTYNDVDQEVFACSGNVVHVYNSLTAGNKYNISSIDSVMDVKVLFNK